MTLLECCRRRHELEAAMMKPDQHADADPSALVNEGVLDTYLYRLGERDRMLWYCDSCSKGTPMRSQLLAVFPSRPRKSGSRGALGRLKKLLARHGIVTAEDALARGLCALSLALLPRAWHIS